jgi:hypothetical protein
MSKNRYAFAIAVLLTLSLAASTLLSNTMGQSIPPAGTEIPTYAYINVAPNPIGIGQTATVNFFLGVPTLTSEPAVNMTVVQTDPDGVTKTLGPFTSDATGGTYTTIVPDKLGNWTFQFFYGGQTLAWGQINKPSQSEIATLTVQEEPIVKTAWPVTPLPTRWWETPISAQNVQEWYKISGPWLGPGSHFNTVTFSKTGGYNLTGFYNPYTESVLAGHILWTKVWATGGVAGGDAGGNEESGSYWSTNQYWPKYAPVIMNGIMYSTAYPTDTSNSHGIIATDLYTGETLWTIDTTTELKFGMNTFFKNPNQYGVVGPYIWTEGNLPGVNSTDSSYNMYDARDGQYICSVINAPGTMGFNPTLGPHFMPDENGNTIGYYYNSSDTTLNKFNMTNAIGMGTAFGWGPRAGHLYDWADGIMWTTPAPNNISGVPIPSDFNIVGTTGNTIVLAGGFVFGQFMGGHTNGWLVVAAMDMDTGAQLWCKNFTYADTDTLLPYTRTQLQIQNGLFINANMQNFNVAAYNVRTGVLEWTSALRADNGGMPSHYDVFNLKTYNGPGVVFFEGFGGDIWCLNDTNGNVNWYTNTTKLVGDPGIETPYGIWPLWVFSCSCMTNDVAYFAVGHEYNPPLFHGAQLLALNITDGSLIWSELDMSIESTAIAYGILLSRNAYDNQIYAFGKGPSSTTVTAPNIGVTIETPITIAGTVMDVSPGTEQSLVALNFPNGLPCISDESQSKWMEYVYQQQPMPTNATGVEVILDVIDANGNYYNIGTATTDTSGTFAFTWTPIIPGEFTVIATFAGSNSYYGSCAEAYFYASDVPVPTPEPTPVPQAPVATYFTASTIIIIIAIAIVGILLFRKR